MIAMKPTSSISKLNGFSLLEMAVLLMVIGLTVAIVLPRVISSGKKDFLIEQKRAVRQARNEVIGYYRKTKSLPTDNAEFQAQMGHKFDRMGLPLEYNSNSSQALTVTRHNENDVSVAFWVASLGHNRVADSGNNYTTDSKIKLGFLSPDQDGFDDVVDYATIAFIENINNGGNSGNGEGGSDDVPNTDDYVTNDSFYRGNSNNLEDTTPTQFQNVNIKLWKGTSVAAGTGNLNTTRIRANSVSVEGIFEVGNNKDALFEVRDHVIFKAGINFSNDNDEIRIQAISSSDYPITVYILKSVYQERNIQGGDTSSVEFTSGGQTYIKITIQSGTLTIKR